MILALSQCRTLCLVSAAAARESALAAQGKYISAVLVDLGWERKRKWASKGHYNRYWAPPT
jgi:hypothetical protein